MQKQFCYIKNYSTPLKIHSKRSQKKIKKKDDEPISELYDRIKTGRN